MQMQSNTPLSEQMQKVQIRISVCAIAEMTSHKQQQMEILT